MGGGRVPVVPYQRLNPPERRNCVLGRHCSPPSGEERPVNRSVAPTMLGGIDAKMHGGEACGPLQALCMGMSSFPWEPHMRDRDIFIFRQGRRYCAKGFRYSTPP